MTSAPPALPAGVELVERHGTPAIEVRTAASSATIHLDGGHVTSWIPAGGEDVLWTSPTAHYAEGASIRGGIPLIGPWFGLGRYGTARPSHGWPRSSAGSSRPPNGSVMPSRSSCASTAGIAPGRGSPPSASWRSANT